MAVSDIESLCAAKGMRMTEQRRTIARVLAQSDDHPDVEELYRRCAKVDDRISISTALDGVFLLRNKATRCFGGFPRSERAGCTWRRDSRSLGI